MSGFKGRDTILFSLSLPKLIATDLTKSSLPCLTRLLSVMRASPFRSRERRLPEHAAAIAYIRSGGIEKKRGREERKHTQTGREKWGEGSGEREGAQVGVDSSEVVQQQFASSPLFMSWVVPGQRKLLSPRSSKLRQHSQR